MADVFNRLAKPQHRNMARRGKYRLRRPKSKYTFINGYGYFILYFLNTRLRFVIIFAALQLSLGKTLSRFISFFPE